MKPRLVIVLLTMLAMFSASAGALPTTLPAQAVAVDLQLNLKDASGETARWLETFAPPPHQTFSFTVTPVSSDADLRVLRINYPSPVETPYPENNSIPGELYLPSASDGKPLPAAIVLDILDGTAIVPRALARSLARRGVAAFYFPMPYYNVRKPKGNAQLKMLDDDLSYVSAPLHQTVMDARRAKSILASLPEIDSQRIGITGVSLGGITAVLVAGVDGEFYRVAPVMAGGDLATIFFHAREMRRMRELLVAHGLDRDRLAKLLASVEPLNFAPRIDPHSCLMINASLDEVIPRTTTDALHKAIGNPRILWMPTGHYGCVLFLPNIEQRVAEFMSGIEVTTLDIGATK